MAGGELPRGAIRPAGQRSVRLGLGVGFAGVVMLSREGDFQASTLGLVLMVLAPIFWAFGSVVARRLDVPGAAV